LWGAVFAAIAQFMRRGRRDFGSVTETRADRYEVQVDDSMAAEATRLIERMPPSAP
jgi:hypothetical protein